MPHVMHVESPLRGWNAAADAVMAVAPANVAGKLRQHRLAPRRGTPIQPRATPWVTQPACLEALKGPFNAARNAR